uniref:Uncharacterized protein n=1 Tax=Avena sativa TaxID=4498 RepID=A0ACD6AGS4_AVESA
MRTSLLLLLLLAGAAVLYAVATPTAAADGEWRPIPDVADPHVQGLGKCAVNERNKVANCGLMFSKVVGSKVQTPGGTRYVLDVDALRINASHKIYQAEIVDQSSSGGSGCKLVSFGPNC